ncbi:MAG TPA: carboxypeptidase-like regulatory domain-containing protein, partial [Vicinamibacterales bacterium]
GRTYEGIQIVFSQKTTDLAGAVTDDRNRPVLDATVIVFPANRERWTFQSRYVRTMRPDTNGRFSIKNLPPEDYLIIAVQNLEPGQASDPEFLTRAREEARPFSLVEGETKAVDIRLSQLVP